MIFSLNILNHNILLVLSVSNKKGIKSFNKMLDLGGILVSYLLEKKYFLFFIYLSQKQSAFLLCLFLSKIYLLYQTKTKRRNINVLKICCFSQKYDFVLKHLVEQMTQILEESIPCTAQLALEYPQLLFFEEYNLKIKTREYGCLIKA